MGHLAGKKILVIEDDSKARHFIAQFLEEEDCVYKTIADGLSALTIFKEFQPDCVLLDILMPKMNGLKVLKRIMGFDPNALVIMTTGVENTEIIGKCRGLGAYTHITKPLDLDSLTKVISEAIELKKNGNGAIPDINDLDSMMNVVYKAVGVEVGDKGSSSNQQVKNKENVDTAKLKLNAAVNLLLKKGILSEKELEAEIEALKQYG